MASQGYRDWVKAGKPYTLIRPAAALQRRLRAYGLVVYDRPNDAHLLADPPEDHTPFSTTGWPGTNRRWNARALDVMPRTDTKAGRKENADIARQLIRDRDAGVAGVMWIKYLNWTDEQGTCQQERWTDPNNARRRTTRASSDRGHIHISGRSDVDDDARAENYDPIARMRGATQGGTVTSPVSREERNTDQYLYEIMQEHDPIAGIIGGSGAEIKPGVPNRPLQRAKRIEDTVASILAAVETPPQVTLAPEQFAILRQDLVDATRAAAAQATTEWLQAKVGPVVDEVVRAAFARAGEAAGGE